MTSANGIARAQTLLEKGSLKKARAVLRDCLKRNPRDAEALELMGIVRGQMGAKQDAIKLLRQAEQVDPAGSSIPYNLGMALRAAELHDESAKSFERAIANDPGNTFIHAQLGLAYYKADRLDKAIVSFRQAYAHSPHNDEILRHLVRSKQRICDWEDMEALKDAVRDLVAERKIPVRPLLLLSLFNDPQLQRANAELFSAQQFAHQQAPDSVKQEASARESNDRIRIGYLSSDFGDHPVALQTAELFELHDRSRFEIIGISLWHEQGGETNERLQNGFDRYIDIRERDRSRVAAKIEALALDILVDLNGYTSNSGLGLMQRRLAPVQVHYLGFPGTLGCDFIDYMIADTVVAPPDDDDTFTEHVVRLPDCFMVQDRNRAISAETPARAEFGLPDDAFVFCGFCATYKITPEWFDIWMRLLQAVPNSVLWLRAQNAWDGDNLRKEAEARGIAADRLVFAKRVPSIADHVARYRAADLFLDTFPYTGQATAAEALWAGLPVVTCMGETFVSRGAGSQLRALRLPELVADTPQDYERLALELATHPDRLADIRTALAANRETAPLFDSARFCAGLEAAYEEMWQRHLSGSAPSGFSIDG